MRSRAKALSWKQVTHSITLHVLLREDGSYVASLHSIRPGSGQHEHHYLDGGPADGTLAPPGLSALQSAAQEALEAWWAGELD